MVTGTIGIYTLSLHDALPIYNVPLDLLREHRDEITKHLDEEVVLVCRSGQRAARSEEHTSELQSRRELVCRLPLEKKTSADPDRLLDLVGLAGQSAADG